MAEEGCGAGEVTELGRISDGEKSVLSVSAAYAAELRDALLGGLGIIRDEAGITTALRAADKLLGRDGITAAERGHALLGKAMLLSALARRESRGAHYRTDYPTRDDAGYQKTTVAVFRDGKVSVGFWELSERRAET